jgi:hypothetical protein
MHTEAADKHVSVRLDHVERMGGELFITALIHWEVSVRGEISQGIGGRKVATTGC